MSTPEKNLTAHIAQDAPPIPTADEKLMARANALVHAVVEMGVKRGLVSLNVTNGDEEFNVCVTERKMLETQRAERAVAMEADLRMKTALEYLAQIGDRCDVKATAARGLGR